MQLVCEAEVTEGYDIRVAETIKKQLHPGEKIRLKIESLDNDTADKKQKAIERLKQISQNSRLGMYNKSITREDAHDREPESK